MFARTTAVLASLLVVGSGFAVDWKQDLRKQLTLLGHRNWVVVADSAYPWQTSPGITTIDTGSDQVTVLKETLKALGQCKHVHPVMYTDAELPFVPEKDAHGVTKYRASLAKMLYGYDVNSLLHEQIIGKLDEAGKTFHVLLLKTNMTIPYTSVFMRLDCAYWNGAQEQRMRQAMKKGR